MACLEWASYPMDIRSKIAVLHYYINVYDVADAHAIFEEQLPMHFKDIELLFKQKGVYFSFEMLLALPLYDAFVYVITSFDLLGRSRAHLQFLLDLVLRHQRG